MNKIPQLIAMKDYSVIKEDYNYKQLNHFFSVNKKKCNFFFKSIGMVSKNYDSLGNSNFFFIGNTLNQDIEWSLIALKFNIHVINEFINNERRVFKNIFFGNYDDALEIINHIDRKISYSQWSILMRMTIFYLKNDEKELTSFTNHLLETQNLSQTLRETIFLHFTKLTKDISEKKDFQSLMTELEYQLNIRETIFIKEYTKEIYEKEIYHQLLSVEKYATSPFNRKTKEETLKYLLTLSYEYSIIDLYKTFSMIISELQSEKYILEEKIHDTIYKLFPKTNLIKIDSKSNIQNTKGFKKLLYTYELYLNGDFERVINLSVKHIKLYPYDIDYLYFLVNSATYLSINPLTYFETLSTNSLLYKLIDNYFNLINNIDPDKSLSKIKKILIVFGMQTQWSMYIYSLLFKFLCLQRDTKKSSFSKSLYYSYHSHPRFFYNLNDKEKNIWINKLKSNKSYKNSTVLKIFKLNKNIPKDIDLSVVPSYRAKYILSTFEHDLEKLKYLYENKNIKFNIKIKIIIDYINLLFIKSHNKLALELMVKNMKDYKMPLCMFNYKEIINTFDTNLYSMPEYVYIFILDNPLNTIEINFVLSKYLISVNSRYSLPSRLAENLTKENDNIDIIIYILNIIKNEMYLEEFVIDIRNSKELIEEQLKIMHSLFKLVDEIEKDNINQYIEKLTIKKSILNNKNFINRNKLRLDMTYISNNIISNISKLTLYEDLPASPENNLEELITNPKIVYYPKADSKEGLLVVDLEKTIKGLLFSEYGILNEIEASIKHGFIEQRLFEPFFNEKLLSSKENEVYVENTEWQQKEKLQSFLSNFTDEVISLISNFKDIYLSSSNKEKKRILDFEKSLIYKHLNIKDMLIRIEFFDDQVLYENYLINTVLSVTSSLLAEYRPIIVDTLNKKFTLLFNRHLGIINNIKQVNKTPVIDALNNAKPKLDEAILDVASWFELYDDNIHEVYNFKEILDSSTIKKMNIKYSLTNGVILNFKGNTYQLIYNIIFNIIYNVLKHASEKLITITILQSTKDFTEIKFINTFDDDGKDDKLGKGQDIIKKSLSSLNNVDILEIDSFYNVDILESNKYIVSIKLSGEIFNNHD